LLQKVPMSVASLLSIPIYSIRMQTDLEGYRCHSLLAAHTLAYGIDHSTVNKAATKMAPTGGQPGSC